MEEYNNSYKWSQAATKGLVLAGVCIAFTALINLNLNNLLSSVLQIARTVLCIWLLIRFMKEYHSTTGGPAMGFARATVLLSSLICAFFDAASYVWLFPGLKESVEAVFNEAVLQIPEEGRYIMENMMDSMPKWTLITGFVKAYVVGIIAAAITNSSINSKDTIFDGTEKEEEEDELA